MALDIANTIRNAILDLLESIPGTSAHLVILTGAPPGIENAETGTRLAVLVLPTNWMATASGGSKDLLGLWTGTVIASGTAGYFRIYNTGETTVYIEGTVGQGSGDLSLDDASLEVSQTVTITTFTLVAGN